MLDYHALEHLLRDKHPSYYSVSRAYLPVEVVHSTEARYARTNELVSLWPASDHASVVQRFEEARGSLESGERFAQLRSTLASIKIPRGIDNIVALACSTMTWAGNDFTTSMAQHALALLIRDFLGSGHTWGARSEGAGGGIKCYAQDPIYTPMDEKVLSEAGFTVVDDPRAFLEVDEASIVISINPDIPIWQIVADIARPAMMIWNKVTVSDQSSSTPGQVHFPLTNQG